MEDIGAFNSKEIEERILDWWEKENIYADIKAAEPEDKVWRFIDGPPYTTGDVHIGTAWNKILKDYLIRYKRMRGYRVTDTPGYDTHGLPIEVVIERKLGITNKKEIIKFGLEKFINECRNFAETKLKQMNGQFKRLGCTFWNWDNPYITLRNTYIQGIWWTLKKAWENGYLYKFYRPQNCCPRCSTALAKHEFEYYTVKDKAIYVKFRDAEDPKRFYLIWTTTPWTLVANTNIMVNPNIDYAEMRVKDEIWVMGLAATSDLLQNKLGLAVDAEDGFSYLRIFKGEELDGKRYIHPLAEEVPYQAELEKQQPRVHTIVLSEKYVQEGEGVGLVHTAPGHGPEDFEVGVEYGIPIFSPVNMDGLYTEEAGVFKGKFVHEVNDEIIEILRKKGTLVYVDEIEHEYAHCWRCKSKLVYRATEQWFFKTTALIDLMLKENEDIYWIPERAGSVNFRLWLENMKDWCISRQRFWGIPLSIWICDNPDCGDITVIGSKKELIEKAGYAPEDLHRPHIDRVTWKCEKCGKGTKKRVPDILDVWLDSGSVMWASQKFIDGYEHYDTWEPADFILEGKDQIRGWFNSLLCSAMVSSKRKNYKACYMHGWVLSHGMKMSKSLGNAISPADIIEGKIVIITEEEKEKMQKIAAKTKVSKFDKAKAKGSKTAPETGIKLRYLKDDKRWSMVNGIETFRFYSVGATPAGRDLNFNYKEYVDKFKVLNTFWNIYRFAVEKMKLSGFKPAGYSYDYNKLSPINRWILSRLNRTVKEITELFDKYYLPEIPRKLEYFIIEDLSHDYITMIRDVVDPASAAPDKKDVFAVLWEVLYKLLLMMAPVTPMLTEEIYLKVFKPEIKEAPKSVHLEKWPDFNEDYIDGALEEAMALAKAVIEEVRSIKAEAKIKLKWPCKALYLPLSVKEKLEPFAEPIKKGANVKALEFTDDVPSGENVKEGMTSGISVYLDTSETEEIKREKILKDILRVIQFLRKQNGYNMGEKIVLKLGTDNKFLAETLKMFTDEIIKRTNTDKPVITEDMPQSEGGEKEVMHTMHFCPEPCYASVKEKKVKQLADGKELKCNYCGRKLEEDKLVRLGILFYLK